MRSKAALLAGALALLLSAPTAPAVAAGPDGFDDYVALGDSYTAGPLIPVPTPGPLGCVRSSANYPAFLAAYLGVRTFTDVSCSAARTEHLFESQVAILPEGAPENTNRPQLLAVTEETDLVTLGIGGNDFGLFGEMIDQCADLAAENPDADAPCRDHFTVDGVDTKIRDAKAIQANIERALRGIRARAPEATVVVVNYLHILPEVGTCDAVPFAAGDYAWGTQVHRQLNASLREAARLHDAEYVDMYAASAGHDACAGSDAWVNGAMINPVAAMSYHPFRSGMEAIAGTTFRSLTGEEPPALSIPELSLVQRLPAVLDVPALLQFLASGGNVPLEVVPDVPDTEPDPGGDPGTDDPGDPDIPDPDDLPVPLEPNDPTAPGDPEPGDRSPTDAAPVAAPADTSAPRSAAVDVLPSAGGPALPLLAFAAAQVAAGAWLVRRRRPAH